ncbi:MAG TPA: ATP synthase F0 subunit B [Terriglobales bacterium]|nr:ATP synthase F0 subunit B [Terriglobales bacterium]
MEQTLRQLGELVLRSVPTIVLLLTVYFAYSWIVERPLRGVLAERRARTEGATEKARADIAAAEAKTTEYEQRLREARGAVFNAQEARRHKAQEARAAALNQARAEANSRIARARTELEQDAEQAKKSLQAESQRLAGEIIRTVLKQVPVTQSAGGAE